VKAAATLRLHLLGTPDLRGADRTPAVSVLQQPKRLALLAWLAGPPLREWHRRESLLALFWPEGDESRARNSLSQALHQLRRSLGEGVIRSVGAEQVGIDRERLWYDVACFERAAAAGDDEEALTLYRGPLLEGFTLTGAAAEFEQWLDIERERLRSVALAAASRLARAAERTGNSAAAVRWAWHAASLAPFDEQTAAALAELLARHGDVAGARAAADSFVKRLRIELELEPAPEISERFERVRRLADGDRPLPATTTDDARDDARDDDNGVAVKLRAGSAVSEAGDVRRPVRLIVLPFRILRSDPDTDFLAFGLADAITASLAGLQSLVVRSQTAALAYASRALDVRELGGQAGVDVVLTGTLLRSGPRLRVSCELTDTSDGTLLWSQQSDLALDDLFALQDQLTGRILEALALPLTAHERQRMSRTVPASAEAYTLFLRGNELALMAGRWEDARDHYNASLRLDPHYAPAWARLGRCYRLLAKFRPGGEVENATLAEEAFRTALRLDPELPAAVGLYAQLEVDLGRAPAAVVRLLWRARVSGGDAELFAALVHACRFCGLLEESVAAHERARRLDPYIPTSVGHTFWMMGDAERALQHAAGDIGYLPALALQTLGRTDEALHMLREREAHMEEPRARAFLTSLRALLEGGTDEARAALQATHDYPDGEGLFYAARSYARLGDHEQALDLLERMLQHGFCCPAVLDTDPWLEPVRGTARFATVRGTARRRSNHAAEDCARAGGDQLLGCQPPAVPPPA
jgi:pentatricopeptide repeat protein